MDGYGIKHYRLQERDEKKQVTPECMQALGMVVKVSGEGREKGREGKNGGD